MGLRGDYGKTLFERADFERQAAQLGGLKGRFLMSINDGPQIRETFAEFHMSEVATTYSVSKSKEARGARAELLISNFEWGR